MRRGRARAALAGVLRHWWAANHQEHQARHSLARKRNAQRNHHSGDQRSTLANEHRRQRRITSADRSGEHRDSHQTRWRAACGGRVGGRARHSVAESHVQGRPTRLRPAGEGMQRSRAKSRRHAEGIAQAEPRIHFGGIEADHAVPEGEPRAGSRRFRGRSHRITNATIGHHKGRTDEVDRGCRGEGKQCRGAEFGARHLPAGCACAGVLADSAAAAAQQFSRHHRGSARSIPELAFLRHGGQASRALASAIDPEEEPILLDGDYDVD